MVSNFSIVLLSLKLKPPMSLLRDAIQRNRNKADIGLDHGAQRGRQRTVNLDGSFNMKRITGDTFNFDPFHWLINTSWVHYWLVVFFFYGIVNFIFAVAFYAIGPQYIFGIAPDDGINDFMQCFFFSNQTFTTVGYGGMHPISLASSFVASLEAFIGLMSFALATGTLYGRFSRPRSKLKFSLNAIIAPEGDHTCLRFMIANNSSSNLMDMEATVSFSRVDKSKGNDHREFDVLNLELSKIAMFPTSWTINHIIDAESPMHGMSYEDIMQQEIEIFATLRGFDETYSQTIYSRMSYTSHDVIYGAKFVKPFYIDADGKLVMDIRKVGNYELASLA